MICVAEAAEIALGETVVVQGLGLLGLYGCAIAKARGARLVIGLDAVPDRLALARKFGADVTLDVRVLKGEDLIAAVREAAPPIGADVAIEVCGRPEAVPLAIPMLRIGGRCVIAGLVNPVFLIFALSDTGTGQANPCDAAVEKARDVAGIDSR